MASYCWAELKSNQHGQKMEQFLDNAIFFYFTTILRTEKRECSLVDRVTIKTPISWFTNGFML